MNYIKRLQSELKTANAKLHSIDESLMDIERYLMLPKFTDDPTVQKQDIFNRIDDLKNAAFSAGFECHLT